MASFDFSEDVIRAAFEGLKKKKKVQVVEEFEVDDPIAEEDLNEEDQEEEKGFGKKKKKKSEFGERKKKAEPVDEDWSATERDYTYKELLTRVFNILRSNNQDVSGESRSYKIVPPQILREGTKKTAFANILVIANRMNRAPEHVIQFLFAELGTSGSMDGNQRLVIKGRFQQKQIETLLKKYIIDYVTCKTCKSADTELKKENRLFFVSCHACGSSRSVSAIKTGFLAQGKRLKTET